MLGDRDRNRVRSRKAIVFAARWTPAPIGNPLWRKQGLEPAGHDHLRPMNTRSCPESAVALSGFGAEGAFIVGVRWAPSPGRDAHRFVALPGVDANWLTSDVSRETSETPIPAGGGSSRLAVPRMPRWFLVNDRRRPCRTRAVLVPQTVSSPELADKVRLFGLLEHRTRRRVASLVSRPEGTSVIGARSGRGLDGPRDAGQLWSTAQRAWRSEEVRRPSSAEYRLGRRTTRCTRGRFTSNGRNFTTATVSRETADPTTANVHAERPDRQLPCPCPGPTCPAPSHLVSGRLPAASPCMSGRSSAVRGRSARRDLSKSRRPALDGTRPRVDVHTSQTEARAGFHHVVPTWPGARFRHACPPERPVRDGRGQIPAPNGMCRRACTSTGLRGLVP
jgi:hypothetical protein